MNFVDNHNFSEPLLRQHVDWKFKRNGRTRRQSKLATRTIIFIIIMIMFLVRLTTERYPLIKFNPLCAIMPNEHAHM